MTLAEHPVDKGFFFYNLFPQPYQQQDGQLRRGEVRREEEKGGVGRREEEGGRGGGGRNLVYPKAFLTASNTSF